MLTGHINLKVSSEQTAKITPAVKTLNLFESIIQKFELTFISFFKSIADFFHALIPWNSTKKVEKIETDRKPKEQQIPPASPEKDKCSLPAKLESAVSDVKAVINKMFNKCTLTISENKVAFAALTGVAIVGAGTAYLLQCYNTQTVPIEIFEPAFEIIKKEIVDEANNNASKLSKTIIEIIDPVFEIVKNKTVDAANNTASKLCETIIKNVTNVSLTTFSKTLTNTATSISTSLTVFLPKKIESIVNASKELTDLKKALNEVRKPEIELNITNLTQSESTNSDDYLKFFLTAGIVTCGIAAAAFALYKLLSQRKASIINSKTKINDENQPGQSAKQQKSENETTAEAELERPLEEKEGKAAELQKPQEEETRAAELQRVQEEEAKAEELQRLLEEEAKAAELVRVQEEEAKAAELQRLQEEEAKDKEERLRLLDEKSKADAELPIKPMSKSNTHISDPTTLNKEKKRGPAPPKEVANKTPTEKKISNANKNVSVNLDDELKEKLAGRRDNSDAQKQEQEELDREKKFEELRLLKEIQEKRELLTTNSTPPKIKEKAIPTTPDNKEKKRGPVPPKEVAKNDSPSKTLSETTSSKSLLNQSPVQPGDLMKELQEKQKLKKANEGQIALVNVQQETVDNSPQSTSYTLLPQSESSFGLTTNNHLPTSTITNHNGNLQIDNQNHPLINNNISEEKTPITNLETTEQSAIDDEEAEIQRRTYELYREITMKAIEEELSSAANEEHRIALERKLQRLRQGLNIDEAEEGNW